MTNPTTASTQTNEHRYSQLCKAVATKIKKPAFYYDTAPRTAGGENRGVGWVGLAVVVASLVGLQVGLGDRHMWGLWVLAAGVVLGVGLALVLVLFWVGLQVVETHIWGLERFFVVFGLFLGFIAYANIH